MSSDHQGVNPPVQRRVIFVYSNREEELRRDRDENQDDKRKKEKDIRNYFIEHTLRERRF